MLLHKNKENAMLITFVKESSFKWCEILSVMKQRAIKENHNYHSHELFELVTVLIIDKVRSSFDKKEYLTYFVGA